jgi:hypothetical protein
MISEMCPLPVTIITVENKPASDTGQAMAKMKDRCLEIFISMLLLNLNHCIFTANSQKITAVNAESVYPGKKSFKVKSQNRETSRVVSFLKGISGFRVRVMVRGRR